MGFYSLGIVVCVLAVPLTALDLGKQSGETETFGPEQRIDRVRQLGKKDASALPTLAPFVKDSDRNVRVEAVKAIVKIDTKGSLDSLVEATKDRDPEVRIRATDGIVNAYLPGYVANSGLSGSLTRGVRQVRQFFSVRKDQVVDADVKIRPDVAAALAVEINDGFSLDARSNAALAAGILRSREAVPALIQGLRSKQDDLMFECLVALQKIQDPAAGPAVGFLARDLEERIQVTALETIGVLRSLPSAPDARAALARAKNKKIQRAALEALAMLAVPADRPTFQQYANNNDTELRAAALEGLGRVREPEDSPLLQEAFDEPDGNWRIHLAAAFALASEGKVDIKEFSPLPYLVESLNSNDRAHVANAYLVELARGPEARRSLAALLEQSTKSQKIALCSVFGATQSEDAVPVLNGLVKDPDADVSFAASKALRILEARRAS
jgi:HEAT repeat protein